MVRRIPSCGGQLEAILGKPHYHVETGGSYPGHLPEMPREGQGEEAPAKKATCGSGPGPSRTGQMSLVVYLHAFVC